MPEEGCVEEAPYDEAMTQPIIIGQLSMREDEETPEFPIVQAQIWVVDSGQWAVGGRKWAVGNR